MFSFLKHLKLAAAALGVVTVFSTPVGIVTGETIALWDFEEAAGPMVADSVLVDAIDGTASANTQIVSASVLGTGFGNARDFSVVNSYVDMGEVANTKLDMTGETELALEAVVYLNSSGGQMSIFDSRQIQMHIIDNRLAVFVRQASGFKGVVSSKVLELLTPYRVGLNLKNGQLAATVDGLVVGVVRVSEPIHSAEYGAQIYIGGLPGGSNVKGIIDNIRVSKVSHLDTVAPQIDLVSPDFSVPVIDGRPSINISITDNQNQVDASSIVVKLNGQEDTGLSYDVLTGNLTGQMNASFLAGKTNKIEVFAKDLVGNQGAAEYSVQYVKWGSGQEYISDEDTLALWHFNEFGDSILYDSSSYKRHGSAGRFSKSSEGVFGRGRNIIPVSGNDVGIVFPPVPLEGRVFTFETWMLNSDFSGTGVIVSNGQFSVSYTATAGIEVSLTSSRLGERKYTTSSNVLELGQFAHIKVVYDGGLTHENLVVLKNGLVVAAFDALADCDFPQSPKLVTVGGGFTFRGILDEVRISKVVRESTNLIRGATPSIELGQPLNLDTVHTSKVGIYAIYSDYVGVDPANVEVLLNGVVQSKTGLLVTPTKIVGELPGTLNLGVNNIEIRVKGDSGNETIHQSRVFYIADEGASEYQTDQFTHGLWHFNELASTKTFVDSSGHGNHLVFTYNSSALEDGVFGKAHSFFSSNSASIPKFSGSGFTIETRFRAVAPRTHSGYLFYLTESDMRAELNLQVDHISISFRAPSGGAISTERIYGIPYDGEYHHMAMVFDGKATSANLMIIYDGVVVYQKNIEGYCDACISDPTLYLGTGIFYDDVRISNTPRKSFNLGKTSGPAIGVFELVPQSTVYTANPDVNAVFSDSNSIIENSMSLFINGVEDTSLTKYVSGVTGTLSGQLSTSLNPGANLITLRGKNQLGVESVKSFYVFFVQRRAALPYAVSGNTLGLWHFDSGTNAQIVADVSGRNFNFNSVSSPLITTGVFDEALNVTNYLYPSSSAAAVPNTKSWMYEFWYKRASASSQFSMRFNNNYSVAINGDGSMTYGSITSGLPANLIPSDGKFHHVAVIFDENNPYINEMILVDGVVVHGNRNTNLINQQFSSASGVWAYTQIDEMRLTQGADYNLTFDRPTPSLLKKSVKYFRQMKR